MANKNKIQELEKQVEQQAESIEECLNELNRISNSTKTLMQENEHFKTVFKEILEDLSRALDPEETDSDESFQLLYGTVDKIKDLIGED